MDPSPTTARQHLLEMITAALTHGMTGEEIVDAVIRVGWQPRPTPDRVGDSDHLEGVLDSGKRVRIEIRHAVRARAL